MKTKQCSKKFFFVGSLIISTVLLVSACSNTGVKSTANTGSNGKSTVLKVLAPLGDNPVILFKDREQYPVWQEFQKMLDAKGVKLEFETIPTAEQYKVVVQTRLASGADLPDIINISPVDVSTVLKLGKQGTLLPINSILDKDGSGDTQKFWATSVPMLTRSITAPDGNIYWTPNIQVISYKGKVDNGSSEECINIRKDWLDKLGLQVPKTAEEFATVMKTFRDKDVNGSGKLDEVLALDPSTFNNGIAQWFGLGAYISTINIKENKVVSPWYQPGIKDYFKYLAKLSKDGIMDTSLIGVNTGDLLNQKIAENKIGATFNWCLETWLEPQVKAGGAKYLPIARLTAVNGIKPSLSIEPYFNQWGGWSVTKNCKNLKAAASLLDIINSEKYATLMAYGVEGISYDVVNGIKIMKPNQDNAHRIEMARDKTAPGDTLFGDCIFPRLRFDDLENGLTTAPDYKVKQQIEFLKDNTNIYPMNNNVFMVLPDDKLREEKVKILTDLTTYSQELATKLALGQASLDSWDKYMKDLKDLGLDRLLVIDQQLVDKTKSVK